MKERKPQDDKENPREIPTRKDPDKTYPQTDPKIDPERDPEIDPNEESPIKENPRTPQSDF